MNKPLSQDCTPALSALIAISMQMLASAQLQDWERVDAGEHDRRELLDALFRTPPRDDQTELWAATIRRALDINAQVIAVVRERKEHTAGELSVLRRGRRGQSEYAKHAGSL